MKKDKLAQTLLAEPDEALKGYLQTLLDEIPTSDAPAPPASELATQARSAQARKISTRTKPAVETPPVEQPSEKRVAAPTQDAADAGPQRPEWAGATFQALYFEAADSQFCLPLVCMKSIVRLEKALTKVPGLPPWHLGVMSLRGENVGVIDLARLMLGAEGDRESRHNYVLLLDDGRWGLACDGLGQAQAVDPADVRWRQVKNQPRFLEGVIRQSLTPLLSTRDILAALKEAGAR